MLAIDSFAYASKLRRVDPKAKFFLAGLPLILCIAFDSFAVSLVTIAFMAVLTTMYSAVSLGVFYKYMTIPLVFLVMGVAAVTVGQFPPGTELLVDVRIGGYSYGVSGETLILGAKLALRSLACLSCLYFFSFNTSMGDIFSGLEKTPLPKVVITLAALIYRYIFILLEEAGRIDRAQRSRLGYNSFKSSLNCMAMLMGNLFIRSYFRADRVYNALESRNFDGAVVLSDEDYERGVRFYALGALLAILLTIAWSVERFADKI